MWYKFEDGIWFCGNSVSFPDGTILFDDHSIEKNGWNWYDEPPQDYIDWINSLF